MKEAGEAEELDEREDDEEDEVVPVESESYVNLRKTMVNKHNVRIDNLLQENGKLCREFQKKKVNYIFKKYTEHLIFTCLSIYILSSCVSHRDEL